MTEEAQDMTLADGTPSDAAIDSAEGLGDATDAPLSAEGAWDGENITPVTEDGDSERSTPVVAPTEDIPDYAAMAESDLAVLRTAIPELTGLSSLAELPSPERYGALREAGLSPVEAYCASHSHLLLRARGDNRAHLAPSVGRTSSAAGARISVHELDEARTLFPTLSDREIEGLYRRVRGGRSH